MLHVKRLLAASNRILLDDQHVLYRWRNLATEEPLEHTDLVPAMMLLGDMKIVEQDVVVTVKVKSDDLIAKSATCVGGLPVDDARGFCWMLPLFKTNLYFNLQFRQAAPCCRNKSSRCTS